MALLRSTKVLLCALLLLTLTQLALAKGKVGGLQLPGEEEEGEEEEEECGEEGTFTKVVDGKCVCEEEGLIMDEKNVCCPAKMSDDLHGVLTCFPEPENGSLAVAGTLIMSFTFLISIQFWTNSKDAEMRRYGYEVISATVSIFTAVLMFQCLNGLVEHFIIEKIPEGMFYTEEFIDIIHFLFWYLFTQFALAWASQALKPEEEREKQCELEEGDMKQKKTFADIKLSLMSDCMSYGVVSAHLTGFAAINAWTGLQQCPPFNKSPLMALVPVPIAILVQIALQRTTNYFREKYAAGDGKKDMFECKWDEACEEAEDDVLGLTLSVMLVNSVRMGINGFRFGGRLCLPNQEQKEEGEICEKWLEKDGRLWFQVWMLFFAGGVFCTLLFITKFIESKLNPEEGKEEEEEEEGEAKSEMEEIKERVFEVIVITLAMAFSWCTFHANKQILVKGIPYLGKEENVPLLTTILALEVTYLGWVAIMILDKIYDLPDEWTPPAVDDSIVAVIHAIALFIGFAWEQTFDESVDSLASKFRGIAGPAGPPVAKFIMGSMISTLIFVAWKRFQLPFIIRRGWDFGMVFSVLDLQDTLTKLVDHNGGWEGKGRLKDFKFEVEGHPNQASKLNISASTEAEGGYRSLGGGDLASENKRLLERLKQAEQEKMKAQQSLDQFMENMLSSLQGMNDTVTRIEKS
mmetsp:Transcript_147841/g.260667  ORF Transcript_147841/g.260667 Transcript_147841/m.260667 type:complete len:689 (-) Transcript_147841:151-2217(-)